MDELLDVVAVNIKTGIVRLIASRKRHRDAEAILKFAIIRRGVDEEFFTSCVTGAYANGDKWGVVRTDGGDDDDDVLV